MKHLPFTGLLFILLICARTTTAQLILTEPESIRGLIRDDSTGQAVPYVQVYNESKRGGCIADKNGYFTMPADIGDTLVFRQIGYLGKVQLVGDLCLDTLMEVQMTSRLYEIAPVTITRWGSYEEFKRSVLALQLPKTRTRLLSEKLFALSQEEVRRALAQEEVRDALSPEPGKTIPGAITIPILSREDLQRINYAKVLEKEKEQRIIDRKYNREIIKQVTNLPDEEIIDFMGFCNFSTRYLLRATDLEIVEMIEKKFREYLEKKSRGELFDRFEEGRDWLAVVL